MTTKVLIIGLALATILAGPFILRPKGSTTEKNADRVVIVVTPHNESIRREFSLAFAQHMLQTHNLVVHVDWRTPGAGTAELERYLQSEYHARFKQFWLKNLDKKWTNSKIGAHFDDRKLKLPANRNKDTAEQNARRIFLESNVSCGVDIFFGGGDYPFKRFASMGYLVNSGVATRYPDWFAPSAIPSQFSGETYYDKEYRWIGASLSSFGICYNPQTLKRLGISSPPKQWDDLGEPSYLRNIAIADPTKSGSVTKALEMLVQQKIRQKIALGFDNEEALLAGWKDSLRLIRRIGANARYFTDSATKIPFDVSQGNAAAGMCIDFYGRTYNEVTRNLDGISRVEYLTPKGGSSISVDPIAMLRGAPNPKIAREFIDFVLSPEGQKIWTFKVGTPGGPRKTSLRRLPIRKDSYSDQNAIYSSDPNVRPYEDVNSFEYVPEWTIGNFNALRFMVRVMCIDTHDELQAAWDALIQSGFPPKATSTFDKIERGSYLECKASGLIGKILSSKDNIKKAKLSKELASTFRSQYKKAQNLARKGL